MKSSENPKSYKIYMVDTGLLADSYNAMPQDLQTSGPKSVWFRGGIAENYVMQQLVSNNIQPYYWGIQSIHEVEFVIRCKTDGVIPVDVKSGRNTRSTSTKAFKEKYDSKYILKVSTKNFGEENGIINIPLYAACLISED